MSSEAVDWTCRYRRRKIDQHETRSFAMPNIGDAGIGTGTRPTPPASAVPAALDVTHRRNRLAGLWAAELLGLIGHAAQDYVRGVMHPGHPQDLVHDDDQDKVFGKLSEDLAGHATESEIRERMSHFLREATRQTGDDKAD
jgi:hypothetical protein